jgi:hypothetical protein
MLSIELALILRRSGLVFAITELEEIGYGK